MGISSFLGFSGKCATCRTVASMFILSAILIIFNKLSDDPWLESKYYVDPNACDLSELTVIENVISGRKDIVALFWENKLGVDVEVRIFSLSNI
jgi:hypothetical protein